MSLTNVDLVVIGSGPGGYAAAFRASDLGQRVLLIEKDPVLGGGLFKSRMYTFKSTAAYIKGY